MDNLSRANLLLYLPALPCYVGRGILVMHAPFVFAGFIHTQPSTEEEGEQPEHTWKEEDIRQAI